MRLRTAFLTCVLTLVPASGAHAALGLQSIIADVANTLEATFPTSLNLGTLTPGAATTSAEQSVLVKSNALWGLRVSTDVADGRMTEWDGTAYVASSPKVLTNPLQWRLSSLGGAAQATSFAALSNTQALVTGSQGLTTDLGTSIGVTFRQAASYADPSAGANDYRIVVTFDASQGY